MKIGLLRSGEPLIPGRGFPANWKIFNFKINRHGWSFFNLPYSAFATPGRYLAEMTRRLTRDGSNQSLLLFNPWLELGSAEVALVLKRLRHVTGGALIVSDRNGIPVAYRLSTSDVPELGRLTLLSCVDADLDARLLGVLLGQTIPIKVDSALDLRFAIGNGYSAHESTQRILRWMAEHALSTVAAHIKLGKVAPPIFAVLPYHAGDLLFFSLAHQRTSAPFVAGVVVARAFEDIIKAASATFPYRAIELERTRSNGDPAWESQQFDLICSQLSKDLLYYYCRPLRPYDASEYHLLDQYAFALGHDGGSSLVRAGKEDIPVFSDRSVLLHFDGGWPLKIYPLEWRQRLIEMLVEHGCRVTALTDEPEADHPTHRNVRFSNLDALKELIEQHSLLIGMDSFPCHYAAHVLCVPVICLFASTQPANSDAPESSRYRALEMGLPCRPCGAWAICPQYGGSECGNFVPPEQVIEAMEKIQNTQRVTR